MHSRTTFKIIHALFDLVEAIKCENKLALLAINIKDS
jgi:hypothetical protein